MRAIEIEGGLKRIAYFSAHFLAFLKKNNPTRYFK
jgi:hypothetical protein